MLEQETMKDLITSYNLRLSKMGYTEEQSRQLSSILLEMYLYQLDNKIKHELDYPNINQFGWYVESQSCRAYRLDIDGEMKSWNECKYFKSYEEANQKRMEYLK